MERRDFLRGLALLAACPLCVKTAYAAEGVHWSYEGEEGPEHWGSLSKENGACSAGSQQSPIDITGAIKADIPDLATDWKSGGTILNNGHTIQVKAAGGTLKRGHKTYELVQYHFHAPSEHLVDGKNFPMEVHFVHKHAETGALGGAWRFHRSGQDQPDLREPRGEVPAEGRRRGCTRRRRPEGPAAFLAQILGL
ncbi:carbonic anhydrase [Sinorhizobium fredii]